MPFEVLVSACNKFTSFGIRRALAGNRYSHGAAKMKDGWLLDANVTPAVDINGHEIASGLGIREFLAENVVRYNTLLFPDLDGDKIIDFLLDACTYPKHEPFDFSAITNIGTRLLFGRKWLKTEGYFCIEALAYAGRVTGQHVVSPELDTEVITPKDIMAQAPPGCLWKRENEIIIPENAGVWCSAAKWGSDDP